jgi:hypothetical protein
MGSGQLPGVIYLSRFWLTALGDFSFAFRNAKMTKHNSPTLKTSKLYQCMNVINNHQA